MAAARVRDVKAGGRLNIEGLDFSPDPQRLSIGFRSPLRDGRALIARLENPPRIIIVSDDVDRKAGRFAGFLLLAPAQLQATT